MNLKKWILEGDNSKHIGKVAIFYIPANKLTKEVRKKLHNFFVKNYEAYTHETSKIQGFWTKENKILRDKHERYEVSFDEKKIKKFVSFIAQICSEIKEDAIYLTFGNESYLITPKK